MTDKDIQLLINQAQAGDRAAFSELINTSSGKLRTVIKRLVGHPDDTNELYQDALLRAWTKLSTFRGESAFSTWLCSIGARIALDYLRAQKPWRGRAQIAYANECARDPELGAEVGAALFDPGFIFDTHEHISYCFGCVGRSLPPEQQVVLVLREVMSFTAKEAAETLGLTEAVVKHQLAAARQYMNSTFEDLCSLVNKQGVCYQCKGLRESSGSTQNDVPSIRNMDARLDIVRRSEPETDVSKMLHDLFWRRTADFEKTGRGSCEAETNCGREATL
jgi:RNA polymerase sigma-70 factor (ECF subfamily)